MRPGAGGRADWPEVSGRRGKGSPAMQGPGSSSAFVETRVPLNPVHTTGQIENNCDKIDGAESLFFGDCCDWAATTVCGSEAV